MLRLLWWVLRVVHGTLRDHRPLQHLRDVVLRLDEGGDEGAEQRGLYEPDEGLERQPREARRRDRRRLVPDGGDVHVLHRRHRARLPLAPGSTHLS